MVIGVVDSLLYYKALTVRLPFWCTDRCISAGVIYRSVRLPFWVPRQFLDHIQRVLATDTEVLEQRVVILDPTALDRDERLASSFLEIP